MEIEESKAFLPSDEQNDKQFKIIDAGFQDNRGWQSYLQEGWVINNIQLSRPVDLKLCIRSHCVRVCVVLFGLILTQIRRMFTSKQSFMVMCCM